MIVYRESRKGEQPQTFGLKESLLFHDSPVPKEERVVKIWINVNGLSGNPELPMLKSFEPAYFTLENEINLGISMIFHNHIKDSMRDLLTWQDSEYLKFCLKLALPQDTAFLGNNPTLKPFRQKYGEDARHIDYLGPCFLYDLRQLHAFGGHEFVRKLFRNDGQNFMYLTRASEAPKILYEETK